MATRNSGNNKNSSNKNVKKAANKMSTKKSLKKFGWGARVIVLVVLAAVLGVSLFFEDKINHAIGLKYEVNDGVPVSTVTSSSEGKNLDVHFVDVGQGDASVVILPDNRTMLIDAGENDSKDVLISYIDTNIRVNNAKITYFDFIIATHSDSDHIGEMKDVLDKYAFKTFYRPNQIASYKDYTDPGKSSLVGTYGEKETLTYKNMIEKAYQVAAKDAEAEVVVTDARNTEINLITPETIAKGEEGYYEVTFYTPLSDKYTDNNDYSPIFVIEYEGRRIALSGDAELKAEEEFVKAVADKISDRYEIVAAASFSVNAIKLGHHGSKTSSSEAYLDVMTKQAARQNIIVIISCGTGNKYGHPHPEVITRLLNMGFVEENILRTDQNGDLALSIKKNPDTSTYELFSGATLVLHDEAALNIGIDITWREIAITIFALVALILIIQPLISQAKRAAKKAAR